MNLDFQLTKDVLTTSIQAVVGAQKLTRMSVERDGSNDTKVGWSTAWNFKVFPGHSAQPLIRLYSSESQVTWPAMKSWRKTVRCASTVS